MTLAKRTKWLFAVGLALRVLAMPLRGSAVVCDYFIPFLDAGVAQWPTNPWTLFHPKFFPYGSVLYGLMALPRFVGLALVGPEALGQTSLSMLLFKLPLLALDMSLLGLLICLAPKRTQQVVVFYWLNPILMFITYVHGQLDVAATCFCMASLVLVLRNRVVLSAVMLALATLCKAHVAIVVPIFLAFLWRKEFLPRGLYRMMQWAGTWCVLTAIGFVPHIRA